MALVAESAPPPAQNSMSTLLDLQLRRRERRSRNFLLNLSTKECETTTPSPEETKPPPAAPVPPKTTEELANELEEWMKVISTFETCLSCNDVQTRFLIPSSVAKDAESIEPYPDIEKFTYTYKGGRDKEKRFHGLGTIEFDNGCYMSGEWRNGKREGKFRMDTDSAPVSYLEGFYINDKVQGRVRIQYITGKWVIGYAKDSVLHGFCKFYDADKKFEMAGMSRNGKPFGTCWKLMPGGGYIVGRVDPECEFTGNSIAFIFPDYRTCFHGAFENSSMKCTKAVTIKGFETEYNCVKVPVFHVTESDKFYKTEVSTTDWLTENPLLEDPYEGRTVYVGDSKTPGAADGLFAARDLKLNSIAAFYNGIRRQKPADSATTWQLQELINTLEKSLIISRALGIYY